MTFLAEETLSSLAASSRAAFDRQYAEWSVLRDAVVPFIGEHAATLFGYAISDENNAVVTSAYLRQALTNAGENADDPMVTEAEQLLIEWARWLARDPSGIPTEVQQRVGATFSEQLRALLIAFAAQTVAANVIESALTTSL